MRKEDYVVSFKLIKDEKRMKVFSVWIAYLPIRSKRRYGKNPTKRNKVLYSKEAKQLYSYAGNATKFFLPTPIGICVLNKQHTRCPNKVTFTSSLAYDFPEEMTLNVGDIHTSGEIQSKIHFLEGEGLTDFKIKLTNIFREHNGVFKAGWKLKDGYYDGIYIWDFHMGFDYNVPWKFVPNKNFK